MFFLSSGRPDQKSISAAFRVRLARLTSCHRASKFEVIQHQKRQIRQRRNTQIRYWTDGADSLRPHSVFCAGRFW